MPSPSVRILLAGLCLGAMACRLEQRPPAGAAREQAAVQAVVSAHYDSLGRADRRAAADPALAAGVPSLLRADIQIQRDLASVWATVRVRPATGHEAAPVLQHLLLRRVGAAWVVANIVTAGP